MRKQAVIYLARSAQMRPNDFLENYEAAHAYLLDSDDPGGARPYLQRAQALLTPEIAQLYPKDGRAQDAERVEEHLRRLLVCADSDFPLLRELSQRAAVGPRLGRRSN